MENTKDQVSTKDFIKSIIRYFQFLGENWMILLIAFLIGNLYDIINNNMNQTDSNFGGGVEFSVDLEGDANQLGGIASAFGIGGVGGGGGGAGLTDRANFPRVIMSNVVFEKALMTRVELFGREDLYVNFFLDSSDISRNEWGPTLFRPASDLISYRFTPKDPKDFDKMDNMVIRQIIQKLQKNTFLNADPKSSLYNLEVTLNNELLVKSWVECLLKATEEFYTDIKTLRTRKLIVMQERRIDSLGVILRRLDRGLSRSNYEMQETVDPYASANITKLNRENTYISNLYMANLNNLESLKSLIVEQTQIFHILSPVTLPLVETRISGIGLRMSGLILMVGILFFISLRKSFVDIMNEEEK